MVTMSREAMSPAVTACGSLPSAIPRTTMSRSVSIPISRSPSTTGTEPTSSCFISFAASASDSDGVAVLTSELIASFTLFPTLSSPLFHLDSSRVGYPLQQLSNHREVGRELCPSAAARLVVGRAEDRRRVHGGDDVLGEARPLDRLAALLGDLEAAAQERLRSRGPERHEHPGGHERELAVEPGAAGGDLGSVRLVVDAPLAARTPLEVLDGVRHIDVVACDAGGLERLVEHVARRTDERMTGDVFLVSRLFADQHHPRIRASLAEHRLRCVAPQIASATLVHRASQTGERAFVRRELDRRHVLTLSLCPARKTGVHVQCVGRKMVGNILKCSMNVPFSLQEDRKSTRLNSSHPSISYAVFCLKKK